MALLRHSVFLRQYADLVEICGIPDVSDKLESEIFGALLAFAKNGTPDHAGLPHWPEVEAEDADTMVFDRKDGSKTQLR